MMRKFFIPAIVIAAIGIVTSLSVLAEKKNEQLKTDIPTAVASTIAANYPQGVVEEAALEQEGVDVYELEVAQGSDEYEVTIAADGTLVEQEREVSAASLPEAISAALAGATVREAVQSEAYWKVMLVKLDAPQVTYEVEVVIDGQEQEIEFAADGTVLEREIKAVQKDDDGDKNADDEDNDNDNDNEDDDGGEND